MFTVYIPSNTLIIRNGRILIWAKVSGGRSHDSAVFSKDENVLDHDVGEKG